MNKLGTDHVFTVGSYAFSAAGEYLGLFGVTDSEGRVWFDLPVGGDYMFQAELFAERYASGPITITPDNAVVTIDPGGGILNLQILDDSGTVLPGLTTSLYNEAGAFLGVSHISDSQGKVNYSLAAGRYLVRVDYLGYPFWSGVLTVTADTEEQFVLPLQEVRVQVVEKLGHPVFSAKKRMVSGFQDDKMKQVIRIPRANEEFTGGAQRRPV